MQLLFQGQIGLAEIQTGLAQKSCDYSGFPGHGGAGVCRENLQKSLVKIGQPHIGGFHAHIGGYLFNICQFSGRKTVFVAEFPVSGQMLVEAVVEVAAGQRGLLTVVQHRTHLSEGGDQRKAGDIGIFNEQILQSFRVGQRVVHDVDRFHRLIAQKVDFRTDFTDADHIAFPDRVFPGGGEYAHLSAGDQVKDSQRLSDFINGFLLG